MSNPTLVPITPAVLSWAIAQSGLTRSEVSQSLNVELRDLRAWEKGDSRPTLSEFRSLAQLLRRQTAVFMLPEPPRSELPSLEFRGPPGELRDSINSEERKFVRQVARIQRALAWIAQESGDLGDTRLPGFTQREIPDAAGAVIRQSLLVDAQAQLGWLSPSAAFRAWRDAVERCGVHVFVLPLGSASARGLSLWNAAAPALVVNSAWNVEARIFTMFHEVGHLVMRTSSACVGYVSAREDAQRSIERWCDRFAASVLMPKDVVTDILRREYGPTDRRIDNLTIPSWLARRMKVSLRASVLRLVDLGFADRALYGQIPAITDDKHAGGGGKGRTRAEARESQFGAGVSKAFLRAVNEDLMTRADALTFLDIGDEDFSVGRGA